jgi:hypothetical protein
MTVEPDARMTEEFLGLDMCRDGDMCLHHAIQETSGTFFFAGVELADFAGESETISPTLKRHI